MGAVIVIAGVLLMVVIHEAAHFVAAKSFGMKATEAFFGFGPRIWSMRRGETEYGVKAFPLGGYVRIIGMNPFEDVAPEDEGRTYRENPFWKKSIVVLAGITSHFVVAAILMYSLVLAYGVAERTTEIGAVSTVIVRDIDESPLLRSDTILSIDGVDIDSWSGTDVEPGDPVTVVVDRNDETLTFEVTNEIEPTPALLSGVRAGDRLIEMKGEAIASWGDFVAIAEANPNTTLDIVVDRGGSRVTLATTLTTRDSDGKTVGFFGVSPEIEFERVGPIDAIGEAGSDMALAVSGSLQGLLGVVTNFGDLVGAVVGDGDVPDERPISPIGLVRISGPAEIEVGLQLLAFVNVFVGVLNFVPLYPLDGGHFAVALYEKIRGRSADVRKLMPVAVAVFLFVVMLGLLGIYFDIVDPIRLPE